MITTRISLNGDGARTAAQIYIGGDLEPRESLAPRHDAKRHPLLHGLHLRDGVGVDRLKNYQL